MKKFLAFIFTLLLCSTAHAGLTAVPTVWVDGDTVTAVKLNNINNIFANAINGGLDNTNVDTVNGYRLYESKVSLPTAGTQGRVVFNTSDNSLNIDNGSSWLGVVAPVGTLATGQMAYYDSGWKLLAPGAQYLSLISNGVSSDPSYQKVDLTNGVSGNLLVANLNGGTNAETTTFWRGDGVWASPAQTIKTILSTGSTLPTNQQYYGPGGAAGQYARFYLPYAGTLKNLYIFNKSLQNATVTIYKNGGNATSLTATATSDSGSSDTSHSVSMSAGEYIEFYYECNSAAMFTATVEFDAS